MRRQLAAVASTAALLARSQAGFLLPLNTQLRQLQVAPNTSQPWHSCWQGLHNRCIATGGDVQRLLDSMQAAKLRDSLDAEAVYKPFMTYAELLEFIKRQDAADTDDEAHARADALVRAGVVLRFNGIVYLRPQEVSELVYRTLPTDPSQARHNLVDVEQELGVLDKQYKQLQQTAQRWPRFWLRFGCAVLALQLAAFYRLTYWELSWDVMEPVAYILSLAYSLMAYMYFLITRGSYLDYGPFQEYWTEQQLEKKMSEKGFDISRYQHLVLTRDRYKRYLAAQSKAADDGHTAEQMGKQKLA